MSRASEYANAVSDLYAQQGQNTARAGATNAAQWGNSIAQLGDFAGKGLVDYSQHKTAAKQDQALRHLFASGSMPAPGQIIGIVGPERGLKISEAIAALKLPPAANDPDKTLKRLQTVANGLHALPEDLRAAAYPEIVKTFEQQGILQPGQLKPDYDPQYWQFLMGSGQEPKTVTPKEPAVDWVETVVDGKKVKRAVERVPGAEFEVPPVELTPDQKADNDRQAAAAGLSREQFAEQQRHNRATEAQAARGGADGEPLVAVMGPDGVPVYRRRSQAEGMRPASNREQGRPVTSGDANRLAEINQSISQAKDLESVIGKTGAGSQIGAALPNVLTEKFGWGADSKSRLATIALVKQIIGKGLEGGVLRAEDERKYAHILPTIGDAPAVAETKIKQLQQVLANKRGALMDSLDDAGYDTTQFKARSGGSPAAPAAKSEPKVGDVVTFQGKRYKVTGITNGQATLEAAP